MNARMKLQPTAVISHRIYSVSIHWWIWQHRFPIANSMIVMDWLWLYDRSWMQAWNFNPLLLSAIAYILYLYIVVYCIIALHLLIEWMSLIGRGYMNDLAYKDKTSCTDAIMRRIYFVYMHRCILDHRFAPANPIKVIHSPWLYEPSWMQGWKFMHWRYHL